MSWTMIERRIPAGTPLGGLGVARVDTWDVRWIWKDESIEFEWMQFIDKPWDKLSESAMFYYLDKRDAALEKAKP